MKRSARLLAYILFFLLFLSTCQFDSFSEAKIASSNSEHLVQIQCLRSEPQDEHVFLNPQQSLTYSAAEELDGLKFVNVVVQANSTNPSFLRELSSDLFIKSYDYFGGLGAWTSNRTFTLANPTAVRQELFLRIVRNYEQNSYTVDNIVGNLHTIDFTSGPAANRVFVRWGIFAALKYLEINQSEVNFSNLNGNSTSVRLEFLPTYASFQLPAPQRIQGTHFLLRVEEEQKFFPPNSFCYVSAFKLDHREVVLGPGQQFLFDVPEVSGWSFVAAAAYTNLTPSLYPHLYPFELVNMAVWDPNTNPLLVTVLATAFGVRNLSNETYSLGIDALYYYWQNQSGLTFSHEVIGSDESSIIHRLFANVTDETVGADVGLSGQYLRFQVPGKMVSFDAPNPVGRYEDSYIPLREGGYTVFTREDRIVVNVTSRLDDLLLTNTLRIEVNFNGEPIGGAAIALKQTGTFSNRTYNTSTDQYGKASISIYSNAPELNQLDLEVSKDEFNYVKQRVNYIVGVSWITAIVLAAVVLVALALLLVLRRRKPLYAKAAV